MVMCLLLIKYHIYLIKGLTKPLYVIILVVKFVPLFSRQLFLRHR